MQLLRSTSSHCPHALLLGGILTALLLLFSIAASPIMAAQDVPADEVPQAAETPAEPDEGPETDEASEMDQVSEKPAAAMLCPHGQPLYNDRIYTCFVRTNPLYH